MSLHIYWQPPFPFLAPWTTGLNGGLLLKSNVKRAFTWISKVLGIVREMAAEIFSQSLWKNSVSDVSVSCHRVSHPTAPHRTAAKIESWQIKVEPKQQLVTPRFSRCLVNIEQACQSRINLGIIFAHIFIACRLRIWSKSVRYWSLWAPQQQKGGYAVGYKRTINNSQLTTFTWQEVNITLVKTWSVDQHLAVVSLNIHFAPIWIASPSLMCLLTKAGTASLCAPTETFNTPTETWTRSITLKARRRKTRTQEYCIETCAEQVDRLT